MSQVRVSSDSSGSVTHSVYMAEIPSGCPLLISLVQEPLRVESKNASARIVLKHTYLEDKYYLKKGSVLMVPSAELHSKPAIWGPTVGDFESMAIHEETNRSSPQYQHLSGELYGSGASVCPGIFLAANEVMMVLVMMVLK